MNKKVSHLASKASAATLALGRFLAPHIREKGAQALSHLTEQSEEKSQKQVRKSTLMKRIIETS
jgi:hypothetical protein